jgi:hypothetical protein
MPNRLEAKFTTAWQKWYRNEGHFSGPVEIKVVSKGPLNYKSDIKPHQLVALKVANESRFCWKLSDIAQLLNPFDVMCYQESPAYFCINWGYPQEKTFFLVPIQAILCEIESGSKSLTKKRAMEICSFIGKVK